MSQESFDNYLEMARTLFGSHGTAADLWEANEYVNLALYLNPYNAQGWILKSQILTSLEDDPAALAASEMAIAHAPQDPETHYIRATVLADMERYTEALQGLEDAFKLLSSDDQWRLEDLYFEKAVILEAMDRPEEAVATFEDGLAHCPNSDLLRAGLEPLRRERMRKRLRVIDGGRGQ